MIRCILLLQVVIVVVVNSQSDVGEDGVFPPVDLKVLGSKLDAAAAAAAASAGDNDAGVDEAARRCCYPTVWQGMVISEFGFAGRRSVLSQGVDQVFVDGKNQRLAGNNMEFYRRGRPLKYSYIMRVSSNNTADFYLFDKTAKKCRYMKLSHVAWKKQCIPANATLRATSSLGPRTGGLKVQSWTFRIGGRRSALIDAERPHPRPKIFLSSNVLVVPKSCVPVVIQEFGHIGRGPRVDGLDEDDANDARPKPRPRPHQIGFVGGMYFVDLELRIKDPSVFTPPSYCKKSNSDLQDEDMDENLEEIIPSILDGYLMV